MHVRIVPFAPKFKPYGNESTGATVAKTQKFRMSLEASQDSFFARPLRWAFLFAVQDWLIPVAADMVGDPAILSLAIQ